jgi:hypothetical protein
MPGPLGERCDQCYNWDRDLKERDHRKKKYMAECCSGAPGDRTEIIFRYEDQWCSDHETREFGKTYRLEENDLDQALNNPPLEIVKLPIAPKNPASDRDL